MKVVMNLSGQPVSEVCQGTFSDVANDWGCKYIESGLKYGYVAANPTFRPDDNISQSEILKLIFKAKGIEKTYNTGNWQEDYMKSALDNGLIQSSFDYNAPARRGWIFQVAATQP